jgi:hypothetical protein
MMSKLRFEFTFSREDGITVTATKGDYSKTKKFEMQRLKAEGEDRPITSILAEEFAHEVADDLRLDRGEVWGVFVEMGLPAVRQASSQS